MDNKIIEFTFWNVNGLGSYKEMKDTGLLKRCEYAPRDSFAREIYY